MTNNRLGPALLALCLVCGLASSPGEAKEGDTSTIIVVRHAEKQTVSEDPGLTLAGEERAHRLRDLAIDAGVTAVFATQYRRTQATVRPLADALSLEIDIVNALDTPMLVEKSPVPLCPVTSSNVPSPRLRSRTFVPKSFARYRSG